MDPFEEMRKTVTLVYIVGRQRSGKDTIANYLCDTYGFVRIALADPVKVLARKLFGMKEKDRQLLINIGMGMRAIDEDVWVRKAIADIYSYFADLKLTRFVVPDVRFPNEYERFRDYFENLIGIHVSANQAIRASREGYDPRYDSHESERNHDKIPVHHFIMNNSTKQALYTTIDRVVMQPAGIEKGVAGL